MTDHGRRRPDRTPVRPDRIRCIERGFAFIPNRFLQDGFFTSLSPDELSLYLFLVPAGDRNGVSFYSYERICEILGITLDDYLILRNRLIDKDLIDFEGTPFQVLSLPARPVAASASARSDREGIERADPASSR